MANPVEVALTKGVITKVATDVVTGQIHRVLPRANYASTYRLTGEAAPTDKTEFVKVFENSASEDIASTAAIDIYMFCIKKDGKVRVDL